MALFAPNGIRIRGDQRLALRALDQAWFDADQERRNLREAHRAAREKAKRVSEWAAGDAKKAAMIDQARAIAKRFNLDARQVI
jgi:hypothetical protein